MEWNSTYYKGSKSHHEVCDILFTITLFMKSTETWSLFNQLKSSFNRGLPQYFCVHISCLTFWYFRTAYLPSWHHIIKKGVVITIHLSWYFAPCLDVLPSFKYFFIIDTFLPYSTMIDTVSVHTISIPCSVVHADDWKRILSLTPYSIVPDDVKLHESVLC